MLELLFPIFLLLIFVVAIATLGLEGLWSNAITLFNVVTAALLATNFWEPVTRLLMEKVSTRGVYLWDFVALWGLFAVILLVLRVVTSFASRYRVKFPKLVDIIGSYFIAAWVGWVLICFTTFTLHTAPLSREFLFGGFKAEYPMFFKLAPDRQWLGFVQKCSLGTFSRGDDHVFDPNGEYMIKYAHRRALFEKEEGIQAKK